LYGGARRRVVPRARLGGNRQSLLRLRYGARPRRKSTGLPARRLLNPVTRGRSLKLTVVIPCYNECSTVAELIERVRAVPIDKQIVVVDDGSTDGTREILAEQPASDELEVHFLPRNAGKGSCSGGPPACYGGRDPHSGCGPRVRPGRLPDPPQAD